jgi:hypothetical protein
MYVKECAIQDRGVGGLTPEFRLAIDALKAGTLICAMPDCRRRAVRIVRAEANQPRPLCAACGPRRVTRRLVR